MTCLVRKLLNDFIKLNLVSNICFLFTPSKCLTGIINHFYDFLGVINENTCLWGIFFSVIVKMSFLFWKRGILEN